MSLTLLKRSLNTFWAVLCFNPAVFLFGQSIHPTDGTYSVGENYPELVSPTSVSITLPAISFDGLANLSAWELNNSVALRPQKGSPNTWNSRTFTYTPTDYEEGTDSITWKALRDDTISYETYKFNIEITGVNNPPVIQNTPLSFSFYENQNYVDTITVFDPDSLVSDPSNGLNFTITGTDSGFFTSTYLGTSTTNTKMHEFEIRYATSSSPNYETLQHNYTFDLDVSNQEASVIVNQLPLEGVTVAMEDVNEKPELSIPLPSIPRTIFEKQSTKDIPGFDPITLQAADPENSNVRWTYTTNNPTIGGIVKITPAGGAEQALTSGGYTTYLPSGTIWTVDYTPTGSSFGTEILTFKAQEYTNNNTGLFSDPVTVTMNVTILYDDSISLNEPSTKSVTYVEESTDSIYDFNPTDADTFADANSLVDRNESAAGAQLWYTLEGADAHLFRVASDGKLYFINPPDYETPLDVGGQVVDNKYSFDVKVRDNENVPYTEDQVAFEVEVARVSIVLLVVS